MNHPIVIDEEGTELRVSKITTQRLLTDGAKPILWCKEGLYGWIPIERVRNALQVLRDKSHIPASNPLKFTWADVVQIPLSTGRVIKKYNGVKNAE